MICGITLVSESVLDYVIAVIFGSRGKTSNKVLEDCVSKSGNWAEYIHSIFTVYSYWIVALRIRGFGDAIYGGGERQDYEVRILNAQRIQNALGRIRVESRQDFISYAASPLVRPFASDPYCN